MPEIEIQFRSDAEYRRLREIRDKYGVQWRGMLIQGAKRLEGRDLRFALSKEGPQTAQQLVQEPGEAPDCDAQSPSQPDTSARHEHHELEFDAPPDDRGDPFLFDAHDSLRGDTTWENAEPHLGGGERRAGR
jgi:hypothetical protein